MKKLIKLIKIISVEVETGKTIVRIGVEPHHPHHPQYGLSETLKKENSTAVEFLKKMMTELGFEMTKPKTWIKENNWKDKNDDIESVLEMDFSDPFPEEEKARIIRMMNVFQQR